MHGGPQLRDCLIGRQIQTVTGAVSTVVDFSESYFTIVVASSGERRNIPMDAIIRTQELWIRYGHEPRPSDVRSAGISEFSPAYMVPLLLAIRECLCLEPLPGEERMDPETERHERRETKSAELRRQITLLQKGINQRRTRLGDPTLDPRGSAFDTLTQELARGEARLKTLKDELQALERGDDQ